MESQDAPQPPPAVATAFHGRFNVLCHSQAGGVHWDLLLEVPGQDLLACWQLLLPPEQWAAAAPLAATRINDHRRIYLDYEGPISNDRGNVTRADTGNCTLYHPTPRQWLVAFNGRHCKGQWQLTLEEGQRWKLARVVSPQATL